MRLFQLACTLLAVWAQLIALDRAIGAAEPTDVAANERPRHTNRLSKETSPYLLLHAHNPVDWYAWGEEALAKARQEKKVIFLSVGYSSCYWCHVMERESFMDDQIAAELNKNFVCIKVDREERPDIDEIYMQALQIYLQLVGSKQGGGWPLSMFLTPDAKPLMGGTYFPPRDKDGRMGFLTVLGRVHEAWSADAQKWQATGNSLADYVADSLKQRPMLKVVKLEPALLDSVLRALVGQYDETYGGFGFNPTNARQPKFPEPPNLVFLLDRTRHKSDTAKTMLIATLEKVSQGGIRDHVGGGFHRYSTDRYWRVPHFEKMLYDNAQLASVYAQAYELAPRADFKRVVDETLEFVLREMTDPSGGFYSAIDAETNSQEGRFYVWDRKEVRPALTPDEFSLWASVYGISAEPNFEGHYIPLLSQPLVEEAKKRQLSEAALDEKLQAIRKRLLTKRSQRPRPLTDTKILAGWNGLMIRGLADASRIFESEQYIAAAAKAAEFVLNKMRDSDGRLLRTHALGKSKLPGYLDDYAFFIDGLIALHQATGHERWLAAAAELMQIELALFWDERLGGLFYTSTLHEPLIARSKLPTDGVTPSGNSVSAANLLYLATALDKPDYVARAEKCIQAATPILDEHPAAVPQLATALSTWLDLRRKSDSQTPKK
ncbi:MAG: thioredoxin domain-containing protein [Planctomycetia bacterium]|nr:thioredoxin domain-containing protein [Planctomycetia bacterium]